jgi:hypothetical protein
MSELIEQIDQLLSEAPRKRPSNRSRQRSASARGRVDQNLQGVDEYLQDLKKIVQKISIPDSVQDKNGNLDHRKLRQLTAAFTAILQAAEVIDALNAEMNVSQ